MIRFVPLRSVLGPSSAPTAPDSHPFGVSPRNEGAQVVEKSALHGVAFDYVGHPLPRLLRLRYCYNTSPSTTKRYAHLADDPLRAATERFGSKFGTYST